MGNIFDGFGAGLGGLLGQGQFGQQQLQQRFQQPGYSSGTTTGSCATITCDSGGLELQPQIAAGPETALAWLDRRVEEMRVKL